MKTDYAPKGRKSYLNFTFSLFSIITPVLGAIVYGVVVAVLFATNVEKRVSLLEQKIGTDAQIMHIEERLSETCPNPSEK